MRSLAFSLIGTLGGYLLGAVSGYVAVSRGSSNRYDKPVEAAMTGAFLTGPLGAIVGGVAGAVLGSR